MSFSFVFLPPQTATTRGWAARLAAACRRPACVVAETRRRPRPRSARPTPRSARSRPSSCAARGICAGCRRRRPRRRPASTTRHWSRTRCRGHQLPRDLQRPHRRPHHGLRARLRARLHHYLPLQLRREWKPAPLDTGVVHLPESTALIVGVGGIGSETARLAEAFGMRVIGIDARRDDGRRGVVELEAPDALDALLPRGRLRHPDRAPHPGDRRASCTARASSA